MTLNYKAKIIVDAKDKTQAIFDSVSADDEFYPENPVNTKIEFDGLLTILVESNHLPHLRANLNSTLRLIQASHETIESTSMC